jgi:hypothetical protein
MDQNQVEIHLVMVYKGQDEKNLIFILIINLMICYLLDR